MEKITYEKDGWGTMVKLGGEVVGRILFINGGYQYRVRGRYMMKSDAEVFPTLSACKKSLEVE